MSDVKVIRGLKIFTAFITLIYALTDNLAFAGGILVYAIFSIIEKDLK